jgi:uncharacterized FlaG/YvyC family protein
VARSEDEIEEARMDTSSLKTGTPVSNAPTPTTRSEPVASAPAIARTELPKVRTVSAVEATLQPKAEDGDTPPQADSGRARQFVMDTETAQMVFRVVDVSSGTIVRQFPEEAMLKLRAYRQQVDAQRTEKAPDSDVRHVEKLA